MRHATSPIVFCFLIFLVMNHVKGRFNTLFKR